jgi:adenylate cyclase
MESDELISSLTGRVLSRIYRRLGAAYPTAAVGWQLLSGYLIAAASIALVNLYLDVGSGPLLRFSAFVAGLLTIIYALGVARGHAALAPVRRWIRGERDPESTRLAWEAAISLPGFYLRTPLVLLFGVAVPAAVIGSITLDLSAAESVALFVGVCVAIGYAGVLDYFSLEGMMRPVVADIATALPMRTGAEASGVSLRTKLLVALPIINVITGVIVAGLTSPDSGITAFAVDTLTAIAVALSISLLLVLRVASAMLRPIGDLQRAIGLVEKGRFDIAVPVTSGDEIGDLAHAFNRMVAGLEERERIREAFGTFVDRDVAEHILANPETLAGEEVDVTVLFLDVREFTRLAERAPAPEVVQTLNQLFEIAVPAIASHGGQVDKFIGDGLMAVFGAPRRIANHADQALAAARGIAAEVQATFGDRLQVGIGLNSGRVVAGSIGAAGRLEYSVIGDTVNVAARVEAATRETGDVVLLTEHTRDLLGDSSSVGRRGEVTLKGRASPVVVYATREKQENARSVGHRAGHELTTEAGSQIGEPRYLVQNQECQHSGEDPERSE